ncbi:type II toxin-antitoxin system RelE/ParE family toxin [Testudinibacter sp. TR-2022]|uniref:type II toxin-antitoxin system RelE/ParE family toxin n=1 Tax=Testudinibacter sp. TR-2022 TaxID=2585029 RepID=UPI00111AC284|nr:type II toxin-antitoxin system RelE/ParE family toxin [Testudinibacter sp. TR-2022]TNH08697.1 excinuclease ABC subunit A [Pasteurellaceae bacterium Phil11]TNH25348.1 excinuclease ABC subunit A [Testudinibacter sp. TR-2022]TNH27351.1 excinuclease ABC subunit A [Testudinibacter sp. TR-2022]
MITHFACKKTKAFFHGKRFAKFIPFERIAIRKLQQLHSATDLAFLRLPPGNKLEALRGDREGQYSIRINDQWRICFIWQHGHAHHVEIVDYH